jgi:hypothetical protein
MSSDHERAVRGRLVRPGLGGLADDVVTGGRREPSGWSRTTEKRRCARTGVARFDETLAGVAEPPVLVSHSLGVLPVRHWVAGGGDRRSAAR